MKLTSRAEDILESMWIQLVEKHRAACDISLFEDDEAMRELLSGKWVQSGEGGATLTREGLKEAEGCIRRHRLAERLVMDILDVRTPLVHETSCDFEHLLHRGIDQSVCTLLGHPRTCPHGRPIPEGACCKEARQGTGKAIMPLPEMKTGSRGIVTYLHTHDREALQKLIAMGLLPKTEVVLLQRFPTLVLRAGKSQFAVDKEMASHIYVRGLDE